MTPSQTKLMDQCRADAEAKFTWDKSAAEVLGNASVSWMHPRAIAAEAYAQALYSERSKAPTVEQVMEVVEAGKTHYALNVPDWIVVSKSDLRSRLTKLFGG